ncbi:MAG: hypothetical protein ABSC08_01050 [Bryobacteraceae bacterium]|jgi:hypothetical protein
MDMPMHLTRAWIIHNYSRDSFLQSTFVLSKQPIANLAIDIIGPALLYFLPPIAVGKMFLSFILLIFVYSCHKISLEIHEKLSWIVPLVSFSIVDQIFLYGFLNYMFSASLFLLSYLYWRRWKNRWTSARLVGFTLLVTCTYLAHLVGFGLIGLSIAVEWIASHWRRPLAGLREFAGFAAFLPGVFIQLYPWPNRVRLDFQSLEWSPLLGKLTGLADIFLGSRVYLSALCALFIVAALGLLVWKCRIRLYVPVAAVGIILLFIAVICPEQVTAHGGWALDRRFVLPGFTLLSLSLCARGSGPWLRTIFAITFLAAAVKTSVQGYDLYCAAQDTQGKLALLGKCAPNSRIYALYELRGLDRTSTQYFIHRANVHANDYMILLNHSIPSSFYAERGVQPIFYRNPAQWDRNTYGNNPSKTIDPTTLPERLPLYDYSWTCRLAPQLEARFDAFGTVIGEVHGCVLRDLRHRD